jgi:cation transport ATPase-like protein
VDIWANSGANRSGLSERHDSVSQRDHRFADRQRISVSVQSVFSRRIFSNRLILWGVGLEIVSVFLIGYTPWGNLALGTAAPPLELWVFIIPFALGMLVLEELRKWVVRRAFYSGSQVGIGRPALQ